jgi:hypothetical protein
MTQANPFYKANLNALRMYCPDLARLVGKTPANIDYETIATKSGAATLKIKSCDIFYYDRENPIDELDKIYEGIKPLTVQMVVFLGFGIGNEVVRYMMKYAGPLNTIQILVVEKDPAMFQLALKTMNLVEVIKHKQIKFMIGESPEELFSKFQKYLQEGNRYLYLRSVKPICSRGAAELFGDYYTDVWKTFCKAAKYTVMNYGNDPKDSLIGVENMLDNLKTIIDNPGVDLLKNKFIGKPAVVVSTGPSLMKNVHLLKNIGDKAVIIAADSAMKPLLKMGYKPHMVTALEREPEIVLLVDGLKKEEVEDIYLAACPVVYKEVYREWTGKNIIVYRNFDHFKWLKIDRGIVNIKSSAGNMAFKIAEYLGCNPIILIGQDLAIDGEKTNIDSHVLGGEQQSYLREMRYTVKGNVQPTVETTASLKLFLESYEIDVAGYRGKCINSTEGGAYINGTQVMPFQEAIDKYIKEPFNPLFRIRDILGQFTISPNDHKKVDSLIEKTKNSFEKIVNLCDKGLKLYDDHLEEIKGFAENPNFEKMDAIMQPLLEIKKQCMALDPENFQLLFAHIGQAFYLNFELELCKQYDLFDGDRARVEILIRQKEWFEIIKGLMEVCVKTLEKAKEECDI